MHQRYFVILIGSQKCSVINTVHRQKKKKKESNEPNEFILVNDVITIIRQILIDRAGLRLSCVTFIGSLG